MTATSPRLEAMAQEADTNRDAERALRDARLIANAIIVLRRLK